MKRVLCILASLMLVSGVSLADFEEYNAPYEYSQGFQDDSVSSVTSVKQALKMRDDSVVTLRGNIVKRLSDDNYLFQDKTGTIVVEIEYKYWAGLSVNSKDTLELTGKIDRDFNKIELEVFSVKKVN
jgi:uncharacterized protein (TIGR00156 family)